MCENIALAPGPKLSEGEGFGESLGRKYKGTSCGWLGEEEGSGHGGPGRLPPGAPPGPPHPRHHRLPLGQLHRWEGEGGRRMRLSDAAQCTAVVESHWVFGDVVGSTELY